MIAKFLKVRALDDYDPEESLLDEGPRLCSESMVRCIKMFDLLRITPSKISFQQPSATWRFVTVSGIRSKSDITQLNEFEEILTVLKLSTCSANSSAISVLLLPCVWEISIYCRFVMTGRKSRKNQAERLEATVRVLTGDDPSNISKIRSKSNSRSSWCANSPCSNIHRVRMLTVRKNLLLAKTSIKSITDIRINSSLSLAKLVDSINNPRV